MYEFASGKINVLEKKVFDRLDQERMLKAPDFKRAFEVLYDTDLGEAATHKRELEEILEEDMLELKKFFSSILENENFILFLLLRFDVSNLKLSLKKYQKSKQELSYVSWGVESPQKIERWIFFLLRQKFDKAKVDFSSLPSLYPWIKKLVFSTIDLLKNLGPREIEISADKAYFKVKLELARKIHPFLRNLTKIEIDILNLKNLLRFENLSERKEFFMLGGNFNYLKLAKISEFKEAKSSEGPEEFLEEYNFFHILQNYQKTRSLIKLEKEFQNFLSDQIFQKSRETSCGIEKVLSYFQRKLNAQHNIRLILFAKKNNIDPEEVEDKLLAI